MKILIAACLTLLYINISASVELNNKNQQNPAPHIVSSSGVPVDEVVVESSLYIKPKQKLLLRRSRIKPSLIKNKPHSQMRAAANATANNFYNNPYRHGASVGNAQDSDSLGASFAGTQNQILTANRNGIQAGDSDQTYIHQHNDQMIL